MKKQNGCVLVVYPHDTWLLVNCSLLPVPTIEIALQESMVPTVASLGKIKIQDSFLLTVYHFHCKLNHWRLGTICILTHGCVDNASWSLNNVGVRDTDPHGIENPNITLQLALHIHSCTSIHSTNLRLWSTVVHIYWKTSTYKWTHTVQTHVVEGSTVVSISIHLYVN